MAEKLRPSPPRSIGLGNPRITSPLPTPTGAYRASCMSAAAKRYKYLRRIFHFRQMDFEFALWQMLYLFYRPQQVYRNFQYRKETKAQYARDDPAFLVLLSAVLIVTSAGFSFTLGIHFWGFVKFLLYVIFVDMVGVGLVVATLLWWVSNNFLLKPAHRDQDVEWGFCFDVHLNAFFPILVILHFFQLFVYHTLIGEITLLQVFFSLICFRKRLVFLNVTGQFNVAGGSGLLHLHHLPWLQQSEYP